MEPAEGMREGGRGNVGQQAVEGGRPKMELKRYIMTCAMPMPERTAADDASRVSERQGRGGVVIYRREICFEINKNAPWYHHDCIASSLDLHDGGRDGTTLLHVC